MARKIFGSPYRPNRRLNRNDAHDVLLGDAEGVTVGLTQTYVSEFEQAVEAVEQNDELSEVGKQRALKKLVADFESHPDLKRIAMPWIAKAEKAAEQLDGVLNARPNRDRLSVPEQIRAEHRHHRAMLDFRALTKEQRHNAVWAAIDKASTSEQARELLFGVIDDGLIDAQTEQRARAALRIGANREAARAHAELTGPEGALTKAKFARDNYFQYLRERAGVDQSAAQLAERFGVPAPVVDKERVFLSRASASNAAVFRAAEAEAKQAGLAFEVETIEAAFGPSMEGGGGSNGNGGEGAA